MVKRGSGVIKQILKDHFKGFWELNISFPKSFRDDIKETVEKAIKCGTRDMGFARYECLGCEGNPILNLYILHVKADFVIDVEKSIQMIGQISNRK